MNGASQQLRGKRITAGINGIDFEPVLRELTIKVSIMGSDNIQSFMEEKPNDFLIAGIGASAGGVQALREFFQQVAVDSGVAYVVILHLSPDYDSQLAQVLQTVSSVIVSRVTEKAKIEPDHIYVVPPNQHLVMEGGFIVPSVNIQVEERRAPVDIFLRTLAESYGSRSVGVLLSGTGANGSMGLKRIKEMGGVVFVQNPKEAEFNEMPRNAIATGQVDEVLPVAEIPARIITYRSRLRALEIPTEAKLQPEDQQQALREIFNLLRYKTGHDFTNYKRATLLRRIERRINIRNLPDLPAYAQYLAQHADEGAALLKDLLISVTNFFRDKKVFETLQTEVIPVILKNKSIEPEIRIWVAGCATGEEAYSIAMLFAERTLNVIDAPKVQIFATDIDEAAIAIAREGYYSLNDAADISPERLERFFNKEGAGYRISREVREMILFANHNTLKDPPFSRLDLVSCRNVLIYLNKVAKDRILETFHFSLNPEGFLFLGTSESIDGLYNLYSVYNNETHVFKSRKVPSKTIPVPESVPNFRFPNIANSQSAVVKEIQSQDHSTAIELHQKLLEEYAPPSLVVNDEFDIVHLSEEVGKYLQFTGGEPTRNLLELIRPELRLETRSALYQAVKQQSVVVAGNVPFSLNDRTTALNIQVRPVTKEGALFKGFILVLFEEVLDGQQPDAVTASTSEPVAKQLEEELIRLKKHLQRSDEQHEFQSEELRASNEELLAMNEELRSAAEELETSKEELQSINEELRTVNQELKVKVEETSLAIDNLQNLVNSADVGTIFLDRGFRVVLFTPVIRSIFNLIPSDHGRAISDITHKLNYNELLQDAETVLDELTLIEREVNTVDERFFMIRLLPYRTKDDRINGVVITFFEITSRKQAEIALQEAKEKYRLKLEQDVRDRTIELNTTKEVLQATLDSSLYVIQAFNAVRNEEARSQTLYG